MRRSPCFCKPLKRLQLAVYELRHGRLRKGALQHPCTGRCWLPFDTDMSLMSQRFKDLPGDYMEMRPILQLHGQYVVVLDSQQQAVTML